MNTSLSWVWGPYALTEAGYLAVTGPALRGAVEEFGAGDTCVREELAAALARAAVGRGWPRYADGLTEAEMDEFTAQVAQIALERGWATAAD